MGWLLRFLNSSIGQKITMSLTGLFLMLFLVVHLAGNLQLLHDDGGEAFNAYSFFMTHNPIIKVISYANYFFILYHAFMGISLWLRNRKARGATKYAVHYTRARETSARNMAWFGIVIFIFILIHMWQFWFQMHFGQMPVVDVAAYDHPVKNLHIPVVAAFSNIYFVIFYVVCMVIIGLHLWHGFWSSFQTLGLNHRKYTPLIHAVGYAYSILIPLGFAIIPLVVYFSRG